MNFPPKFQECREKAEPAKWEKGCRTEPWKAQPSPRLMLREGGTGTPH